jgi:hypothetical protein
MWAMLYGVYFEGTAEQEWRVGEEPWVSQPTECLFDAGRQLDPIFRDFRL